MSFKKPFQSPPVKLGPVYLEKVRRERKEAKWKSLAIGFWTFFAVAVAAVVVLNWWR
jgi:hypothetical protein